MVTHGQGFERKNPRLEICICLIVGNCSVEDLIDLHEYLKKAREMNIQNWTEHFVIVAESRILKGRYKIWVRTKSEVVVHIWRKVNVSIWTRTSAYYYRPVHAKAWSEFDCIVLLCIRTCSLLNIYKLKGRQHKHVVFKTLTLQNGVLS